MSATATTPSRFRSPPFPNIPLQRAVERAEQLYRQERDHVVPMASAARAWSMSPTSSGPVVTSGALRQYGLIDYEGVGDAKKMRLTHDALRIILDKVPTSPSRVEALRKAFLSPKIFSELWTRWKADLPSDQTMINYLVLERRLENQAPYSEQAATELLANYRASMPFAILSDMPSLSPQPEERTEDSTDDPPPHAFTVGDHVQWTSNGIDQFKVPRRIVSILPDGNHVQVFGSNTALPMSELTIMPPPKPTLPATGSPVTGSSVTAAGGGDLNVLLAGNRLQITADVDLAGLAKLKAVLGHYESILKLLATPTDQIKKPEWASHTFMPGETVPATTPFTAHHIGHMGNGLIEPIEGETFPECPDCVGGPVRYTLA